MREPLGDKARLSHIQDSIRLIKEFVKGASFEDFERNAMMFSACVRHIEIIGEAATNLSPELRLKYPQLPWGKMVGMRNILIHKYFGVDEIVVWGVIEHDLPIFTLQIETILQELEQ